MLPSLLYLLISLFSVGRCGFWYPGSCLSLARELCQILSDFRIRLLRLLASLSSESFPIETVLSRSSIMSVYCRTLDKNSDQEPASLFSLNSLFPFLFDRPSKGPRVFSRKVPSCYRTTQTLGGATESYDLGLTCLLCSGNIIRVSA